MANVAYVRSSTAEQNNEYQIEALKPYGIDKWFIEKKSGRTADREELQSLLDWVREGDSVYVYDWSRCARSLKTLLGIIDTLNAKNVTLVSLKEGKIDNSATGKLIVQIMGAVQEWQVNIQREKALDGIAAAKREGKYHGRKPTMVDKSQWENLRDQWQTRKISKADWAKQLGISRVTLDKIIERENNGENIYKK